MFIRALAFLFSLTQFVLAQQPTPIVPDPSLTPGDAFDVTVQDICVLDTQQKVRNVRLCLPPTLIWYCRDHQKRWRGQNHAMLNAVLCQGTRRCDGCLQPALLSLSSFKAYKDAVSPYHAPIGRRGRHFWKLHPPLPWIPWRGHGL